MRPDDGRVVSNFVVQALSDRPLTMYGEGAQTRSFTYVDDLIDGIWRLLMHDDTGPSTSGDTPLDEINLRSEEHTSELQSRQYLVCRLLLEKKKNTKIAHMSHD